MRFKYYLRGIGLGILFSVFIMIIAVHFHKNEILSDKEIIERAKALGMVEKEEAVSEVIDTEMLKQDEKIQVTTEKVSTENNSQEIKKETKKTDNKKKDIIQPTQEDFDYVMLTIKKGDVCRNVAETLAELKIVKDADDFRQYMGKKGYAQKIHTGQFKIPKEATYDEIIDILLKN